MKKELDSTPKILKHSLIGAVQSFLKGCLLRGGITLVIQLFKVLRGRLSILEALKRSIGETTIRFGTTIGTFSFLWKFINNIIELKREKQSKWNSGIAGCIAGLSILFESKENRSSIAQQLFMRSTHAFVNARKQRKLFTIPNGDAMLFMVAYGMILFAGAFYSDTIPRKYFVWCSKLSRMPPALLNYQEQHIKRQVNLGSMIKVNEQEVISLMQKSKSTAGNIAKFTQHVASQGGVWSGTTCSIMHPQTDGCITHLTNLFRLNVIDLIPLYLSVSGVPYVLFKTKKLIASPLESFVKIFKAGIRSTTFMTSSVVVVQVVHCFISQYYPNISNKPIFFISGLIGGSMILIEQKSRRAELAMFVLPKALESLYKIMISNGQMILVPHLSVFGTCFSTGILMALYQKEPHHIAPLLRRTLQFLVGTS